VPSPVPPKHELVEIGRKILAAESVIDAHGESFQVREHPVNPRHQFVGFLAPDCSRQMRAAGNIGVAEVSVRPDFGTGASACKDKGMQSFSREVSDRFQTNACWETTLTEFNGPRDHHFTDRTSALASFCRFVLGSKRNGGLVDFDYPRERRPVGIDHSLAELVQKKPCAAVGTDPELGLQLQCRNPIGVGRDKVRREKPRPQGQSSLVHDRPGRNRGLAPAILALPSPSLGFELPAGAASADRADEAAGPALPCQIRGTGIVVRERRHELLERRRTVPFPAAFHEPVFSGKGREKQGETAKC